MNGDDQNGATPRADEMRPTLPSPPDDIGPVQGRTDIPAISVAPRTPEIVDPPAPASQVSRQLWGTVYVPEALASARTQDGLPVAGECDNCGAHYFWPVLSSDGVNLLQCASCYKLYRHYAG